MGKGVPEVVVPLGGAVLGAQAGLGAGAAAVGVAPEIDMVSYIRNKRLQNIGKTTDMELAKQEALYKMYIKTLMAKAMKNRPDVNEAFGF